MTIDEHELVEIKSKLKGLEAETEAVRWLLTTKKIILYDELSEETEIRKKRKGIDWR